MGELAGEILLPKYQAPKPDTSLVSPLVAFLDSLPDICAERELSWAEDEQAIGILRALIPPSHEGAQECVASFTHARYREGRTLVQWYMMCKHVVEHLQYNVCRH